MVFYKVIKDSEFESKKMLDLSFNKSSDKYPVVIFLILTLLILLMVSCRSTNNFIEEGSGSQLQSFYCQTSPSGVVDRGQPLSIKIAGGKGYNGRMTQDISGQQNISSTIVYSDGNTYVEGGQENKVILDQPGKYTINLRTIDNGINRSGGCSFEVVDPCPGTTYRKGINLVIAIDNSGSQGVTDCNQAYRILIRQDTQAKVYHCAAETNREVSVKLIAQMLAEIANKGGDKSRSNIAFTTFPKVSNVQSNASTWFNPQSDMDILIQELKILRNPELNTPYIDGLINAKALFDNAPDHNKPKKLLFITDGFPDDQDPKKTLEIAESLKNQGVKILILVVVDNVNVNNQQSLDQAYIEHKKHIESYIEGKSGYKIADHYNYHIDKNKFYLDLHGDGSDQYPGLLANMSSESPIFIDNSDYLNLISTKMISTEALKCEY